MHKWFLGYVHVKDPRIILDAELFLLWLNLNYEFSHIKLIPDGCFTRDFSFLVCLYFDWVCQFMLVVGVTKLRQLYCEGLLRKLQSTEHSETSVKTKDIAK